LFSLARFGEPFFQGQFYNFSEAARIIALAFAFCGRINPSIFFNFISLFIHAIMGLIGFAASSGFYLKKINFKSISLFVMGSLLFTTWIFYNFPNVEQVVPDNLAIAANKLLNFHFFPSELGLYSFLHWESTTPFIILSILYFILTKRRFHLSVCILLLLTLSGLLISQFSDSYQLIQLNLQRASFLATFLMVAELAMDLPDEFKAGRTGYSILLLVLTIIFVSSFFIDLNIFSLIYTLPLMVSLLFLKVKRMKAFLVSILLTLYFVFIGINYFQFDPTEILFKNKLAWMIFILLSLFIYFVNEQKKIYILILSILFLSLNWSFKKMINYNPEMGISYLEVQKWAKGNTEPNTVFSPPPTISYGWREFSERPSAGNFREWLLTSWLYERSLKNYKLGIERALLYSDMGKFNILNINVNNSEWINEFDKFYNSQGIGYFKRIYDKYDVKYFIFKKNGISIDPIFRVLFENKHFIVAYLDPR
jgi:hypothetical protein